MENQNRKQFIKTTGTALLVTSGISVFGLFTSEAKPVGEDQQNPDQYFMDGYYDDGYYDDGYTGINSISPDRLHLNLFPNPSDGNFSLDVHAKAPVRSEIFIQDLAGKTLIYRNCNFQQGDNLISFESTDLARGVYILSVVTAKRTESLRLFIAK